MSALSAPRNTEQYGTGAVVAATQYGVAANKTIYPGAIVVLNSSGYLQPATTALGLKCVGRATTRGSLPIVTTGLSDGALTCYTQTGTFWYANNDGITIANRDEYCYLVDDQTVALSNGGGTRSVAGLIIDVDATLGVSVQMGFTNVQASPAVPRIIADPGNAGAIVVTASGTCNMTSAGAETRTLAIPTFVNQRVVLNVDTYVGNIVVTSAQAINEAGNNTLTFGSARDAIELAAITVGGALRWQVGWNDGCALSTV